MAGIVTLGDGVGVRIGVGVGDGIGDGLFGAGDGIGDGLGYGVGILSCIGLGTVLGRNWEKMSDRVARALFVSVPN